MQNITWSYIKEKWAHTGFQKYFRNMGWMFTSRIFCMIISFFTTAFIARKLGPGNFGQLNYAVSFIGLFGIISSLGIDNILYRDLIKNPDKKREYLGSALIIKLLAGLFAVILVSLSAFLWTEDDVSRTIIFILSGTFIFNAFQIINYEFQARVKSKYPSIISILVIIILNSLKIIAIVNGKGVIYLALILLLESILYAFFFWFVYEKKIGGKILEWKFDKTIAIILLIDSWPIIFTNAFTFIYSRIDQILIKHLMDSSYVGIYSSAVSVAEAWYLIPTIIIPSLFPAMINAKMFSKKIYHARIRKISLLLLVLSVGTAVITSIFAPLLIRIIYGTEFLGAVIILRIYVWSNVGIFLGSLLTNYLIAENRRKTLSFITFLPMLTNLILNLIFIPKYGIVGSAYATLISYSLFPILIFLFKEPRKIFFNKNDNE